MFFGKRKNEPIPIPVVPLKNVVEEDPTGWIITNVLADVLLINTVGIQCLCLFAYTLMHGSKVFSTVAHSAPISYKLILTTFSCAGGGILVPLLINTIPTPLTNDLLLISIVISCSIHQYFPVVREILSLSRILKASFIVLYETTRAANVVKMTILASEKISPSFFSFPVLGPIICGTIAGCGGMFLPLSKGLEPIKDGLLSPITTALIGASVMHLFLHTSLCDGIIEAKKKAQIHMALFFIITGLSYSFKTGTKQPVSATKRENKTVSAPKKEA